MGQNIRALLTRIVIIGTGLCTTGISSSVAEESHESVEIQLKAALEEGQKNTGALEPWQKILFKDEVLPQYQRFIRDYRSSGVGLKVEIDYESLKHYLLFYGPKALKQENPRILVLMQTDTSCEKCMKSSMGLRTLLQSRLEKRGLVPIAVNPTDTESQLKMNPRAPDHEIQEKAKELSKKKNTLGSVVLIWAPLPKEETDTAHADENRYMIRSFLQIGLISVQTRQKEIFDTDDFEQATAKLLADIFTDIGAKLEVEQPLVEESDRQEVLLTVSGIKNFAQYIRIKNLISQNLKDTSAVEDRKFSRGRVTFALNTNKKNEELKTQMEKSITDAEKDPSLTVAVP